MIGDCRHRVLLKGVSSAILCAVLSEFLLANMGKTVRTARKICIGLLFAGMGGAATAEMVEIILQPSDLIRRGNVYIEQGEIEKAKETLSKALDSKLTSRQRANAHNSLCVANIKEEEWGEAMRQCNAAIKISRVNWRFYNNRGNVYLGLGQLDLARENYQRGLRIAPKSRTLATNVAILEDYAQRNKPKNINYEKPT